MSMLDKLNELGPLATGALIAMVVTVITGRTLKKAVVLALQWIARRTDNKVDDELVDTAANDLGVTDTTIDGRDDNGK